MAKIGLIFCIFQVGTCLKWRPKLRIFRDSSQFYEKNGPKCLNKFYKIRISIKLDGFSKIIEKFVEKEVIYSSTIKIDESASK